MATKGENNPVVVVEHTTEEATNYVAMLMSSIICEAVGNNGKCYLALAGGTTPHSLYQRLAEQALTEHIPWSNVEIFFGDERTVPQDDVASNYRMVHRSLLDHVPIDPFKIHPMPGDAEDLAVASAYYEEAIRHIVPPGSDKLPRFDLILLGMGGDGHVASLFPDTDAIKENKKLVTACFVPVLGRDRMTFTFPLINAARNVIMFVTGKDKAEAASAVLDKDPKIRGMLPASSVKPKDGQMIMVLDQSAARLTGMRPD